MITPKQTLVKRVLLSLGLLSLATGVAYATFTSNTVQITGGRVTTGSAGLKLCDITGGNSWSNSIQPTLLGSDILPNEERDLFGSQEVYVGNDSGSLAGVLAGNRCLSYLDPASTSNAPMKLIPTVSFTDATCPPLMQSAMRLRFEVDGIDTGHKALSTWANNTTSYSPVIVPGQVSQLKAFAELSSTATAQATGCDFMVQLTGKQA